MPMKLIESTQHLLEELQQGNNNYYVQVSPLVSSDKHISINENKDIVVFNEITRISEIIALDELDESILNYYIEERDLYSYN